MTIKYAVPHLKHGGGGSILITSSVNGTRTFSNTGATAYSATKTAQVAVAKMSALELAPFKIRVNVICPGAIETDIKDSTEERNRESVKFRWSSQKGISRSRVANPARRSRSQSWQCSSHRRLRRTSQGRKSGSTALDRCCKVKSNRNTTSVKAFKRAPFLIFPFSSSMLVRSTLLKSPIRNWHDPTISAANKMIGGHINRAQDIDADVTVWKLHDIVMKIVVRD